MLRLACIGLFALISACVERATPDGDTGPTARVDSPRAAAGPDTTLVGNAFVDSALTEPQLVLHGSEYRLHLPPAMAAALAKEGRFEIARLEEYDPNVRRYVTDLGPRQALSAVVGDFDGDGRDDAVMHARKRQSADSAQVFVVILNQSAGPRVIEVERYPLYTGPLGEYLLYQKAETVRSAHEKQPLTLTTDAFQIVFFEKAAQLYYYQNGQFKQYFTAD
jgi:hypothetical protein